MKIAKNKTKAILIALFLVLTLAFSTFVALPPVNAHSPKREIPTWTYVSITPEIVGVGQNSIIVFWQNLCPPTANGNYGDRWSFNVDLTHPDGTNETLGPFVSDPVGAGWTNFVPGEVGTYTAVARFIGKTLDNTPMGLNPSGTYSGSSMGNITDWLGDYFLPSTSPPTTLTVVQEPVPRYAETPLPTDYWTRPVYGTNRDWWSVMGQWLAGPTNPGRINDFTDGPESAHILWSRPVWLGGVMGGQVGEISNQREYYTGQSYESYGSPGLVVDGKIFYSIGQPPAYGWYCVDLYTGKTLYYENNTDARHAMPSMGQILNIDNPNQHGGFSYLWRTSGVTLENPGGVNGTVWEMLDTYTGNMICRIANVSTTGTQFNDEIGSICYLSIANRGTTAAPNWRMYVWNTTQAIWANTTSAFGVVYWSWRPTGTGTHAGRTYGTGFDGNNGFSLNVTCPAVQGSIRQIEPGQYVVGGTTGSNNGSTIVQGNFWALSLKPGEEGKLLYNFTFNPPSGLGDAAIQSLQYTQHDTVFGGLNATYGIYYFKNSMTRVTWVYSLDKDKTGKEPGTLLWDTTKNPEDQWNFYGWSTSIYKGKLINMGYSGILIAYDIWTGQVLWNWTAPTMGLDETPYRYTPLSMGCAADGKMYLYTSEHSPTMPLRRDAKIYCVNTETGKLIWAETTWPSGGPIIADGRIICYDLMDGEIYCYGMGSSATTVSAPQNVPSLGSSVTITGTVTDNTPTGRLNTNAAGISRFNSLNVPVSGDYDFVLKGTPAISDASMDEWMEYMYHQRPMPTNATGVNVSLDTVDPNGNLVHIGDVTSDLTGAYGYVWKPEVPGTYKIIATFAGSAAYGSSFAQTYMGVGEEAPIPTAQPIIAQPPTEMYIGAGVVAIIIAIAIGFAITS